jgi:hypothetical protein
VDDEDELLEPGRPAMSRPARIAGAVLLAAVLVAVFAVRFWPSSNPQPHQAALGTPPPPAPETSAAQSVSPGPPPRPWPTARNGCGGDTEVAIAHTQRPAEHTGLRLLVGSDVLRVVDFDSGRATPVGDPLPRHQFVDNLTGTLPAYATTVACGVDNRPDLVRIGTDLSTQPLDRLMPDQYVFAGGDRAWLAVNSDRKHPRGTLTPIGGGPTIQLPPHVYPQAIDGDTLVGNLNPRDAHSALVLVDLGTGRIRSRIAGAGYPLAVGAGQVLWSDDCDPTHDRPCTVRRMSLDGKVQRSYRLPRPTLGFGGAVSPDGRSVALLLERPQNSRVDDQHPFPPSSIAVLHLDSGRLDPVPGVLLPPKEAPSMAFSADSRWLAVGLDAGRGTRLLAWRPGLHRAYETRPVPGSTYGTPGLAVLAP